MKVISVNVGLPKEVEWRGETVLTGIFKAPIAESVSVGANGLEGDGQADLSVHGGRDKAVYSYPSEHYPHWREELPGCRFPWGAFGENLTTEGLREEEVHIGDRVRVGTVELVATQPRLPCAKLALRHREPSIVKRLLRTRRCGIYWKVVTAGVLAPDEPLVRLSTDPAGVTILDVLSLATGVRDSALAARAVEHPDLAEVWREELRQRLAAAGARGAEGDDR